MVKPKSRASGGHRRDSGGPLRYRRAARTATLAHVPNYAAPHHAALAARIERHRTKEMVTEPLAEETQARLLLLLGKIGRTEPKQPIFGAVLGGDVQLHQVRLAAASALGSWEVLPAERADFLKPVITQFSPPHWQGCQGQAAGQGLLVGSCSSRKKGWVGWPHAPHLFPNGKEEE